MEAFLCRATNEIHRFSGAGGALVACAILAEPEPVMSIVGKTGILAGEISVLTVEATTLAGIIVIYLASLGLVRGTGLLFY